VLGEAINSNLYGGAWKRASSAENRSDAICRRFKSTSNILLGGFQHDADTKGFVLYGGFQDPSGMSYDSDKKRNKRIKRKTRDEVQNS
jgi:hypothetical protein